MQAGLHAGLPPDAQAKADQSGDSCTNVALEDAEAHLEELRGELREAHVERRRMLRDAVALISEIIGAGA